MFEKNDFKSKMPYQDKKPEHPSMMEIKLPRRQIEIDANDSYSEIDQFVCTSISETAVNCVIGKDEECIGCKTCIRLGF
ncbi:MAG: hypothetical protein JW737_10335 [Acidobacteria bacterium]|nr:hypothetical protein [Acidobacteriota bacterium]